MDTTRKIYLDAASLGYARRKITLYPYRWYAEVQLNRDGWVDQAHRTGDDPSLHPGFQEAVDRCMDAAADRIWLGGYTGGFTTGHGERWVTLAVPYEIVDEAVEALKAAELDADISKLDTLTAKLTVPYGVWLAPGERVLRRGPDFACTPAHFLWVLRGEAKRRGLRVNGRVDEDSVWVRPALTAAAKLLRKAHPERYTDDPDRYSDTSQVPGLRRPPAVPWEREDPRATTTTRILTPSPLSLDPKCVCGWHDPWQYATRNHDRWHMSWSTGVPVPGTLHWEYQSVAVVATNSSVGWRKLAYECARIAQRDGGYDFPAFPHPSAGPKPSDTRERAYLYQAHGRVIGFLAASDRQHHGWWDLETTHTVEFTDPTIRPRVDLIFVAEIWRRRGVASALVRALADDSGIEPAGVSWSTPFSVAGKALAAAFANNGVWIS